jgi:hypothetical protein
MSEREYVIEKNARGYELRGPALATPSVFETESQAVQLARHLIGCKSGGGFIVHSNGMRDLYQGTRHLTQDGNFQR